MTLPAVRPPFTDPRAFPSVFDEPEGSGFAALGLPQPLVRALARAGIDEPFPIQAATIPDGLAGRDVLARARTGSGKTLAFGLPLLARVAAGPKAAPGRPRALVLVPTRELAMQVNDALVPLAKAIGRFSRTAVGGVPYDRQLRDLSRGVDLLVATPGRLGDLIERGACALSDVDVTVLDEADQMADMGFLPDVMALLEQTPAGAQRLLFSATLDGDVDALVRRFLVDPVTHEIDPLVASVSTMDHHLLLIPPGDKLPTQAARRYLLAGGEGRGGGRPDQGDLGSTGAGRPGRRAGLTRRGRLAALGHRRRGGPAHRIRSGACRCFPVPCSGVAWTRSAPTMRWSPSSPACTPGAPWSRPNPSRTPAAMSCWWTTAG